MKNRKGAANLLLYLVIGIIAYAVIYSNKQLFATVPYSNLGQYKFGEPEFYSIVCKPFGSPNPLDVNASTEGGTSFKVEYAANPPPFVESARASANGVLSYRIINSAGQALCRGDKTDNGCDGRQLISKETYTFRQDCGIFGCFDNHATLRIRGVELSLSLEIPQIGIVNNKLPGTINCISQDVNSAIFKMLGFSSKIDSSNQPQIVTLQENQGQPNYRGFREIPAISAYNYNGQAGACDISNKKIIGFTSYTAVDGTKWAIKDSGNVLYDGSNTQFCCSANDCRTIYGMSASSGCQQNKCVEGTSQAPAPSTGPTAQCITADQCGVPQYVTQADGTNYFIQPQCVSSQCLYPKSQIACNPTLSYPNNQCCQRDLVTSQWKLGTCTASLSTCETLGGDACCTDKQSKYTIKSAPSGKFCCDKNEDGVGFVTASSATCFEEGGEGTAGLFGLGDLFKGLGDFFKGLAGLGQFIIIVLVLVVIIVVAKLLK